MCRTSNFAHPEYGCLNFHIIIFSSVFSNNFYLLRFFIYINIYFIFQFFKITFFLIFCIFSYFSLDFRDVIAFWYSGNIGKEASVNKLATEEVTFSAG